MVSGTVQRNPRLGVVASLLPDDLIRDAQLAYALLGSPEEVKEELDRINAALHTFWQNEPDWCMRAISGLSTRVTELVRLLYRVEIVKREFTRLRTMDALPLLDELDRQFKIHSRLLEARGQDLAIEGIRR